MTRLRHCLGAATALLAAAAALPAAAQWGGSSWDAPPYDARGYARPLPPFEVRERLEDDGYEDVGPLRFRGSVYETEATTERGRRVILTVDAFRGRVLDRRPLFAGGPGRPMWGDGGVDPRPLDSGALGGRRPSRFDEMPADELARRGELRPAPGRQAAIPPDEAPAVPYGTPSEIRRSGPGPERLPAPSDRRLAPNAGGGSESEPTPRPRRETHRAPDSIDGLNPDAPRAARPAAPARQAARPDPARPDAPRAAPAETPAAPPRPPVEAAKPAPQPPVAQAAPVIRDAPANGRPVRVIGGVTTVPGGQSGVAPQNNLDATPSE